MSGQGRVTKKKLTLHPRGGASTCVRLTNLMGVSGAPVMLMALGVGRGFLLPLPIRFTSFGLGY